MVVYESSRGRCPGVESAEAIRSGIAPDGGLYTPSEIPLLSHEEVAALSRSDYASRAEIILSKYLPDFDGEWLASAVRAAYSSARFDDPDIAPIRPLSDREAVIELWHGPTSAFKDLALQLLPLLLRQATLITGEDRKILVLVATSGDTGKAALAGFQDMEGVEIIVFYPASGVSEIQKAQMVTQRGSNVHVFGISGNFDDAQTAVKAAFTDEKLRARLWSAGYVFSSANSINWGRLVPQIVYYLSAYEEAVGQGLISRGAPVNVVVPTGNFGNILAAYYAHRMGMPLNRLICASNRNNVLSDFIATGVYSRNRDFHLTMSPSMDILISSNLERFLYELSGHDAELITTLMRRLFAEGEYEVPGSVRGAMQELMWGGWCSEEETLQVIRRVWERHRYLMDPHTAVGQGVYERYASETEDTTFTLLASTASPYKFPGSVLKAVDPAALAGGAASSEYALMMRVAQICAAPIPQGLRELPDLPVIHREVIDSSDVKATVARSAGLYAGQEAGL